jgi:hypothetical protein
MEIMRTTDEKHSNRFEKILKGKKVDSCRYLTREEADDFGWYKRPLCIIFTDSTYLVLQSDDEGNDGGAAFLGGDTDEQTIYTI